MGGNSARRKGHDFEREVVNRLLHIFPDAKRNLEYQEGEGKDIVNTGHFRIQCKCGANPSVWQAMREAAAKCNEHEFPTAIVKRTPRQGTFVTMTLILICLVGYMALKPGRIKHELYNKYFNNGAEPLAYDSTLRGSLTKTEQNTIYDTLLSRFKLGVGDYLRRDYTKALENFGGILSRQDELENERFYPLLTIDGGITQDPY